MSVVQLAAVQVPGDGEVWRTLGFSVDDDTIALANGAIRLGSGALAIEVAPGSDVDPIDGIPVGVGASVAARPHPNGALELDHLVVVTDSIERTSAAIEHVLGLEQRRLRETDTVRQAFHRFADAADGTRGCILEVVQRPDVDRAELWGLVVTVDDIDRMVAGSDGSIGAPRPAVQSGRRIATVSRSAGLSLAVAVMSR